MVEGRMRFRVRPRFTLWALLVLITLIAIPLGYVAQRRAWNESRRAVYDSLSEKGIEFSLHWPVREAREDLTDLFDGPIGALPPEKWSMWDWWIDLCKEGRSPRITVLGSANLAGPTREAHSRLTDEDLRLMFKNFPELESVYFTNESQITDQGLSCLAKLTHLKSIDLYDSPHVTGAFFRNFSSASPLKSIRLSGLVILDGNELTKLSQFSRLTTLALGESTQLTDETLRNVHLPNSVTQLDVTSDVVLDKALIRWLGQTKLRSLKLDAKVSRLVAPAIAAQTKLHTLKIINAPFVDEDFAFLSHCEDLEFLMLDCMPIEGVLLERIPVPQQLDFLSLRGTLLTDGSIPALRRFTSLIRLELDWTPITGEGFEGAMQWPSVGKLSLAGCRFSGKGKWEFARIVGPGFVSLPDNWSVEDFEKFTIGKAPYSCTISIEQRDAFGQAGKPQSVHTPERTGLHQMHINHCPAEEMAPVHALLSSGHDLEARIKRGEFGAK